MMLRAGSGWQYVLADLSLILFMVTAAALAQAQDAAAVPSPRPASHQAAPRQVNSPQSEPLAVYRAGPNAPALGQWLHDQSADPRQQLTIVAHYEPGGQTHAMKEAEALVDEAGKAGMEARIVVEPGHGGATATLAFDSPGLAARN